MRRNRTKTDGTNDVCFRIHIGAISPSGCRGEVGVKGESGECKIHLEGGLISSALSEVASLRSCGVGGSALRGGR